MPPLPKAVRIRTATGWQDIAIVGPPGPQGQQGPKGDVGPAAPILAYQMPFNPDDTMPDTPLGTLWIDSDEVPLVSETVRTLRTGQSYIVAGVLGSVTIIPSFFVPTMGIGQITKLVGARHKIQSGSGILAQLTQNGINVGVEMSVTQTKATTTFPTPVTIADGDEIGMTLQSPLGTPQNLSLTAIFEHQI
jgi:hypothetical protein